MPNMLVWVSFMIVSWINAKGETSMGKLADNMEQKFIEFCINNQLKAMSPEEMKIYYPCGKVEPKIEQKQVNNATLLQVKKKWWQR